MSRDGSTREAELLDLARKLLTPACPVSDEDDGRSTRAWIDARIRWHRLDGNDALADELEREEKNVREALEWSKATRG